MRKRGICSLWVIRSFLLRVFNRQVVGYNAVLYFLNNTGQILAKKVVLAFMDNFLLIWVGKTPCLWLELEGYCPKHGSNFIKCGQNVHNPSWTQGFAFPEAVSRRAHHRLFNVFPVFRASFLRLSPTVGSLGTQLPKTWILHVWPHVPHVLPLPNACVSQASCFQPCWLGVWLELTG